MMNAADAIIARRKRRWERAELLLEIASLVGGALVVWGLWSEGMPAFGSKLVLAGVVIEVAFGWCVLVASRKLQNILETNLEELRLETAEANARAAEANKASASASARAVEATKRAADANLKVEQMSAEREVLRKLGVWPKPPPISR